MFVRMIERRTNAEPSEESLEQLEEWRRSMEDLACICVMEPWVATR